MKIAAVILLALLGSTAIHAPAEAKKDIAWPKVCKRDGSWKHCPSR